MVAVNTLLELAHPTLDELCTVPFSQAVVTAVVREVEMVTNGLGSKVRSLIERRLGAAVNIGKDRTSMQRDVEVVGRCMR